MAKEFDIVFHEWSNVLASIPQGWQRYRKYVQAIVEVASKFTALHHAFEVLVSCGHEAHVDAMGAPASEALEFLFLQNTEELRLQCQGDIPYFVKKQSSFVGQLETANLLCDRACKGPSLVAEEFTLEQVEGNRSAVELNQGLAAAGTRVVNCVSDEFLAGARLSLNENCRVRRRNSLDLIENSSKSRAVADDLLESADPAILFCDYH
jgi:hypothetical protein